MARHLDAVADEQRVFLERTPRVSDVSVGELSVSFSASERYVRICGRAWRRFLEVPLFHSASGPSTVRQCPRNWQCRYLWESGLRSASRTRMPAFWAS